MSLKVNVLAVLTLVFAGLSLAPQAAQATTIDWNDAGTVWGIGTNWGDGTGSAPANDLTTDIARFNLATYTNQPTSAAAARSVAGIIIGDGVTSTGALTITTNTVASRLAIGSSGIVMNVNSGAVTSSR